MLRLILRRKICYLLFGIVLAVTLLHPYRRSGPPIRSDGMGYHLWTQALLSLNFSFCDYADRYPQSPEIQGAILPKNPSTGVCQNKYPPGLALLRLPFMAPLIEWTRWTKSIKGINSNQNPPLISRAEHQMSLILGALALLFMCVFCLKSLSYFEVRPQLAESVIFYSAFGLGLFHYATFDSCFSHIYSALGVSILVWLLSLKAQAKKIKQPGMVTLVTVLFLVLVRNTNVFIVISFLIAYVWIALLRIREIKPNETPSALTHEIAPGLLGILISACVQLAYNFYSTGRVTLTSYGSEPFLWTRPMPLSILFSYERGLFTYYPILGVAIVAGLAHPPSRKPTLYCTGILIFYVGLYGFWHSWMLGEGFGHRGFVELAPPFILILGVSLNGLSNRIKWLFLGVSSACTWVTLQIMWGYWQGTFPYSNASADSYWTHIFLGKHLTFGMLSGLVLFYPLRQLAVRPKTEYKEPK